MPTNYTTDSTVNALWNIKQWNNTVTGHTHVHRHMLNTNLFAQAERHTYNQLKDWVRCEYLYKSEEVKKEMHREEFVDKNHELDAFLDEYKRKEG